MSSLSKLMGMVGGNSNNNPLGMIMGLLQNGKNPQAIIEQIVGMNPQYKDILSQAQTMAQGKSDKEIQDVVMQLAKQNGIDVNQVLNMLGKK